VFAFIETRLFNRLVGEYLLDDEYLAHVLRQIRQEIENG
jgi:hypothetical protein